MSRNFYVCSLHVFPVNQVLWVILMNSCMWAPAHFSKRIFQNVNVKRLTLSSKWCRRRSVISDSVIEKFMAFPRKWIVQMVSWRSIRYLMHESPINPNLKSTYSVIRFYLGGRCLHHLAGARFGEKDRLTDFARKPRTRS